MERVCRVKWQPRLGNPALKNKQEALDFRASQNTSCFEEIKSDEFCRYYQGRNVLERNDTLTEIDVQKAFSIYKQNDWWRRASIIRKFKQAGLTIIARIRANNVLKKLGENRGLSDDVVYDFKPDFTGTKLITGDYRVGLPERDPVVDLTEIKDQTLLYSISKLEEKVHRVSELQLMAIKDRTEFIPPVAASYAKDHRYNDFLKKL